MQHRRVRERRDSAGESSPICRCRVLYLGSSVPHITKDGLQGIQEPLRELYPSEGVVGARGIDSWLSVWSNGLLLENVDERKKRVTRFFPIESLHYCAAVRYVMVPTGAAGDRTAARFLPLDSPFSRAPSAAHPPLFSAILRRTSGIKVLECHAFICRRETPANALVRCCFHAFADSMYARQLDGCLYAAIYSGSASPTSGRRAQSVDEAQMDVVERLDDWETDAQSSSGAGLEQLSVYNGDENHKVWAGSAAARRDEADGPVFIDYDPPLSMPTLTAESRRPRQRRMPAGPPPPPTAGTRDNPRSVSHSPGREYSPRTGSSGGRLTNGHSPSSRQSRRCCRTRPLIQPPPPHQQQIVYSPAYFYGSPQPHMHYVPLLVPHAAAAAARAVEEPAYLPSARAGSPTASYQPGQFPYGAYLNQRFYSTCEPSRRRRHTESPPQQNGELPARRRHTPAASPLRNGDARRHQQRRNSPPRDDEQRSRKRAVSREDARRRREVRQLMQHMTVSGGDDLSQRPHAAPESYPSQHYWQTSGYVR